MAEAVADAPEAHEVAAEGASVAEALAAEVEEPGGDDEDSDSVAEEVDDTEAAVSADGDDSEDDEVAADGAPGGRGTRCRSRVRRERRRQRSPAGTIRDLRRQAWFREQPPRICVQQQRFFAVRR